MALWRFVFLFLLPLKLFADEGRYLLVPARAHELSKYIQPNFVVDASGDAVILKISEPFVETLSKLIHENFGGCGGFVDVTEEILEGSQSLELLNKFQSNPKMSPYFEFSEVQLNKRVAEAVEKVRPDFIHSFLIELTSFDDRSALSDNGTKAAEFIAQRAGQIGQGRPGFEVKKVATRTYPKQPSIVATVQGRNQSLGHIVIGAHMDTLSQNKPGADDDGSGSAVVMEALRVLIENNIELEQSVDFVWYAAEERGLVGSANVVREFQKNNTKVAAVIQFDMTGWVNPARVHDIYLTDDYVHSGLNRTLEKIIDVYLPNLSIGYASCGYACSDHATWTANKIPAVYPFESHHDDINRYIHTSSDKIEHLSIDHMTNFAKIAVAFLGEMATFH